MVVVFSPRALFRLLILRVHAQGNAAAQGYFDGLIMYVCVEKVERGAHLEMLHLHVGCRRSAWRDIGLKVSEKSVSVVSKTHPWCSLLEVRGRCSSQKGEFGRIQIICVQQQPFG